MLEVKRPLVLVARVLEPKLDARAVLGAGPDDVLEDLGDVHRDLLLGGLP